MKVNTKSWTTFDTVRIADYEKTPKIYIYFLCPMCSNGVSRGTSILGEVRNVEISRITQQLLCSKSHDFLALFATTKYQ